MPAVNDAEPVGITPIGGLSLPAWLNVWFAMFPTVQSLTARLVDGLAVIGSYVVAG